MKWMKKLSEAIVLQSLEDLYTHEHRMDALRFFNGDGFDICASIIGLKRKETEKVFQMVNKSFDVIRRNRTVKKSTLSMQNKFRPRLIHVPRMIHGISHHSVGCETVHHS